MNWRKKETAYEELPQDTGIPVERQVWRKGKGFYAVFLLILLLTNMITGVTIFWVGPIWHKAKASQRFDAKIETPITYSPANQIIRYLDAKPYEAEIFQRNRWRGPPEVNNEDIDRAWSEISEDAGLIRLDGQDLLLMNLTDNNPLRPFHRLTEENGGGFAGMIEVFHLLHCLRNLRETQFYNWDYYKHIERWRMSERMIADHNDHCLDVIRMSLMV
ncbi:hypothetical protein GQ53DRAFT_823845 [Thozetella sp. PMI_491]|nr:hypothetical protein GQ53DRAFT_823845 [Thozetella sp. PMI_491]